MTKATKIKAAAYIGSAVIGGLTAGLIAGLGAHCDILYLLSWIIFGAGVCATGARLALHICYKDYSAEMFQVTIYQTVALAAWIGAIFSETWGWTSLSLSTMVAMVLMAFGTRFIEKHGNAIEQVCVMARLEKEALYYPKDDIPGAEEDPFRPLCEVEGKFLTIAEAEELGYVEIAENARRNLAVIYGVKSDASDEAEAQKNDAPAEKEEEVKE